MTTYQEAAKQYRENPTPEVLEEQVQALVAEMSLKEKIYMLSGHTIAQTQRDLIKTSRAYNVSALPGGGCRRLGIPPVKFTDGPRGVVMGNSTCFPSAALRASTFDPSLEYRIGTAIAKEAIAQDANLFAGVCINLARNPRWGRTQESYGEDPFVLGSFGSALAKAVQDKGVIACVKHFALNSMEDLRFYVDVHIDDRALHEVYLPHFKKCVDGGALSIMGAYNRYEEYHCCESKKLLTDILRKEWGFDGFVMSDFVWGVYNAERSLRAGLDLEMMFTMKYSEANIRKCLNKGLINPEHLDRANANIIRTLLRLEPDIVPQERTVIGCSAHRALALEAAEKGMVLLENNGLLPLSKDSSIVVCGSFADVANTGDHGSSRVYDKKIVTPYKGLKEVFADVTLAGCTDEGLKKKEDPVLPDNASVVSSHADIAVVCAGFDYRTEGEYFVNTSYKINEKPKNGGGDRLSLRLSRDDTTLIKELKRASKKVIVVLYSGSAILIDEWKDFADAVIMNYYSGCEGGTALAHLLSGAANFTGRLPFTAAQRESDYPDFKYIGQRPYVIDYGYYHGYTLLDKVGKQAAYPFGYGLSYSTYAITDAAAALNDAEPADQVVVTCKVTNTGDVDGAEVVQVYIGSKNAQPAPDEAYARGTVPDSDRPIRLLKGFARVELAAGETKEVTITVPVDELRFRQHDEWVLDDAYVVYVGKNAADLTAAGEITF